jgi:hypothetical protein
MPHLDLSDEEAAAPLAKLTAIQPASPCRRPRCMRLREEQPREDDKEIVNTNRTVYGARRFPSLDPQKRPYRLKLGETCSREQISMASTAKASKVPLCFVIGPIGPDGSPERKHADLLLHLIIKYVLEAEEFGYKVKRADEDAEPGMIGDRVISDILHAELVVADLTDLNPNALYELGIRHSTRKPTIHVAMSGTPLPFDNISHRTILVDLTEWQSIKEGRTRLAASALAINQADFQVSNPITQANASFMMRESADPRDRVISELQERVQALEKRTAWASSQPGVTYQVPGGGWGSQATSLPSSGWGQSRMFSAAQQWRPEPRRTGERSEDEENEP